MRLRRSSTPATMSATTTRMRGCSVPLKRRRSAGVVELPTGVHRVIAGGREYFYWQPGRGTKHAAKAAAIKPADPHDPAFWVELRRLQGLNSGTTINTFAAVCDLFETSAQFNRLSEGTKDQYRRQLHTAKVGFGSMAAEGVRASMIRGVVEGLADRP